MTDKEKLEKLMKLADAMYYAAQNLTTDASRLHKAMDEYHKFIIYEYHKEEPTIPEIVDEHFDEMLREEPISEDLEKAAKHYLYSNILYDDVYVGNPTDKDCIEMFKAGANWQKQKDAEVLLTHAKCIDESYKKGIKIGKFEMKQQIMKNAVSGTIEFVERDGMCKPTILYEPNPSNKMQLGDKVKLIIIKED